MPDFAVRTAFTATDKISPAFKRMGRSADVFGSKGSRAMMKIRGATSGLITSMKGLIPLFGVAIIANYAKKAVDLASALTEVQNVVDTTFKKGAKDINKWSKTAISQFGLSELQAKKFTSTMGAVMKPAGIAGDQLVKMSKNLAGLSGDFASFFDLPTEEAFNKIRSGIIGETEPLKTLGIVMTQANLKAFALTRGITKNWKVMTQAEQTQLRYNFIMAKSRDAQGDFNKTLKDSYANQKRVLGVQFDQFLANIMVKILPKLTEAFSYLNKAIAKIDTDKIATGLEIIVKLLPYLVGGFLAYKAALIAVSIWQGAVAAVGFIKYFTMMIPLIQASIKAQGLYNFLLKGTAFWTAAAAVKLKLFTLAQWLLNTAMSANPIGLVIIAIAAFIAFVILAIKYWDKWGAAFMTILGPIGYVISFFKTLYDRWQMIKEAFTTGGIIAGLKAIGKVILDSWLYPIQKVLELIAKIPGMGKLAGGAAAKIKGFREGTLYAPNQSQVQSQKVRVDGDININNAPAGTTARTKKRGANRINMNVVGANQ